MYWKAFQTVHEAIWGTTADIEAIETYYTIGTAKMVEEEKLCQALMPNYRQIMLAFRFCAEVTEGALFRFLNEVDESKGFAFTDGTLSLIIKPQWGLWIVYVDGVPAPNGWEVGAAMRHFEKKGGK